MFNPMAIMKKMKKDSELSKDMKSMSEHAMETMKPEIEMESEENDGEEEMPKGKKAAPQAKVEIEIMLQSSKKKGK